MRDTNYILCLGNRKWARYFISKSLRRWAYQHVHHRFTVFFKTIFSLQTISAFREKKLFIPLEVSLKWPHLRQIFDCICKQKNNQSPSGDHKSNKSEEMHFWQFVSNGENNLRENLVPLSFHNQKQKLNDLGKLYTLEVAAKIITLDQFGTITKSQEISWI